MARERNRGPIGNDPPSLDRCRCSSGAGAHRVGTSPTYSGQREMSGRRTCACGADHRAANPIPPREPDGRPVPRVHVQDVSWDPGAAFQTRASSSSSPTAPSLWLGRRRREIRSVPPSAANAVGAARRPPTLHDRRVADAAFRRIEFACGSNREQSDRRREFGAELRAIDPRHLPACTRDLLNIPRKQWETLLQAIRRHLHTAEIVTKLESHGWVRSSNPGAQRIGLTANSFRGFAIVFSDGRMFVRDRAAPHGPRGGNGLAVPASLAARSPAGPSGGRSVTPPAHASGMSIVSYQHGISRGADLIVTAPSSSEGLEPTLGLSDWLGRIRTFPPEIPGVEPPLLDENATGCVIGPHHILTCAHALWDTEVSDVPIFFYDDWPAEYRARSTATGFLGPFAIECAAFDARYWDSGQNFKYDLAVGVLEENTTTSTGLWISMCDEIADGAYYDGRTLSLLGYPAVTGFTAGQSYHSLGSLNGWDSDRSRIHERGRDGYVGRAGLHDAYRLAGNCVHHRLRPPWSRNAFPAFRPHVAGGEPHISSWRSSDRSQAARDRFFRLPNPNGLRPGAAGQLRSGRW